MSDFEDRSVLTEATSGKWYRFAKKQYSTMLLDLPNKILLGFHVSNNNFEIFIPDENDIYHRAGDLTFRMEGNDGKLTVFSEALKEITLGKSNGTIENKFSDLTSFDVSLNLDQSKQWWNKRLDKDN